MKECFRNLAVRHLIQAGTLKAYSFYKPAELLAEADWYYNLAAQEMVDWYLA